MKKIITRFAPSPTGLLHIGNVRVALINWLYAKKYDGKFILRIDDTDNLRSEGKYINDIKDNLLWLGLYWDDLFYQSKRSDRYKNIIEFLIKIGRLYPCYETPVELNLKKKIQLSNGKPPIYDRYSLKLSVEEIEQYKIEGRKPHYRFLINYESIQWTDLIKGNICFNASNISDPIVVREDGSMTYLICSIVDDIDYDITHIIRGEDHITNTAIQIQMFKALNKNVPQFGHLGLFTTKKDKISKRIGGFDVSSLRNLEPMTVNSFLALIGSSKAIKVYYNVDDLIKDFNIEQFSANLTIYSFEELKRLNHKILCNAAFDYVKEKIKLTLGLDINENFWITIKNNISYLYEVKEWWEILYQSQLIVKNLDLNYLNLAESVLPIGDITINTWKIWTQEISKISKRKGKELYLPLRLALTGKEIGPEMSNILPLLGRDVILNRLRIILV